MKAIWAVKSFWGFLNASWPVVKDVCYSILPLLAAAFFIAHLWVFLLM